MSINAHNKGDVRWRGVGNGPRIPASTGSMYRPESGQNHAARFLGEYRKAKVRGMQDGSMCIRLHCPNQDCCMRLFRVEIDYQYDPGYEIVHAFACPYCGKLAVLDADSHPAVEAGPEYADRQDRDARQSVWHQIRRQRGERGCMASEVDNEVDIKIIAELYPDAKPKGDA